MFITNCWYTAEDILMLKNDTDIIFVDGLSIPDEELAASLEGIKLRFYRYEDYNDTRHQMFTMTSRWS